MRGTITGGGAAMAGALTATLVAAQPAAMRAPLWQGVQRVTVEFSLPNADPLFAERLKDAAMAAARDRSAWPISTDRGAATRDSAILAIRYDGASLSATVRRAVESDDAEGGRLVPPVALATDADAATLGAAIATVIERALPGNSPTRNDIRIRREN